MKNLSNFFKGFLCFFLLVGGIETNAQITLDYRFSQYVDTYVPITGGATTTTGAVDNNIAKVAIPGGFSYLGRVHDSVTISNNGHISFPTAANTNSVSTTTYSPISAALANTGGAIAAFANDLQGLASGEVRYVKVGNEFVVQWANYRRYGVSGDTVNFQVRLNQTTGEIKIVYGHMVNANSTAYQPQVGLRGIVATDFNNRLVTATTGPWVNSERGRTNIDTCIYNGAPASLAAKPANGTTFVYTPNTCITTAITNITNIGLNSATLNLDIRPSAISYEYYYSTSSTNPTDATTGTIVTTNTPELTGLSSNTTYYVWARVRCSATETSAWGHVMSFTTLCEATNLPYLQNFEASVTPALPSCITIEQAGNGNVWATYTLSSNKLLRYAASASPANAWVYTQGLNLTAGQIYRVSYRHYKSSAANAENMKIAIGTNASASAMNTILRTYAPITATTFTPAFVDFTVPTSGVYYIGFHAYSAQNLGSIYLDDISVDLAPSCIEPSITLNNITTNSVDISLSALGIAPANGYEYYYSTTSTAPTATTTGTSISNSATINGLQPANTYYIWARAKCSATEYSVWSEVATFTTPCGVVTSLPWTENFDGITANTTFTSGRMPSCWVGLDKANVMSTGTYTIPRSASNVLAFQYNTATTGAWAITPSFALEPSVSYRFKFYYRNYNTSAFQSLKVFIGDQPAIASLTTNIGATLTNIANTTYQEYYVDFTVPATGNYNLAIQVIHTNTSPWYLLVDDISLDLSPSCVLPTNLDVNSISSTSASISWNAPAIVPINGYEYYYSTSSVTPDASITGTAVTATSATLSNLLPNTNYYVWIRSACTPVQWSAVRSFRTACEAMNVPYSLDFESTTTPELPSCVSTTAVSGNTWSTGTVTTGSITNTLGRYVFHSSEAADAWLYTQGINLTAGTSYRVSYKYYKTNNTAAENLKVAYGTAPMASAMTNIVANYNPISVNTLTEDYLDFVPTTTGVYYFGFQAYSARNLYTIYIDDIYVDYTPTCFAPTAIQTTNITSNSVDLQWTAPTAGTPLAYEYYYSTSSVTPLPSQTGTLISNTSMTLGSLNSNTNYYIWFRSSCGANETSVWTSVVGFQTLCSPEIAPTQVEDFSTFTGNAPNPACWSEATSTTVAPFVPNIGNSKWTGTNFAHATAANTAMRINLYGNSIDWMISNQIDLGATPGQYRLKYKYALKNYNTTTSPTSYATHKVDVIISTDGGATWTNANILKTHAGNYDANITEASINLSTYSGVVKIAFRSTTTTTTPDLDFFVDDFVVEAIPSCVEIDNIPTISNININSVDISWLASLSNPTNGYEYYISQDNIAPTAGTTGVTVATGTSVTIASLTSNTTYYVWVRALCSNTDRSVWSASASFTTMCDATNIPYSQNFETATTPTLPFCTYVQQVGSGNLWATYTLSNNKLLRYGANSSNAANTWFYTQGLNLTAGQVYRVSYRHYKSGAANAENIKVAIGTTPNASSMNTVIQTVAPITATAFASTYADFIAPTTGVYYVGFHAYSASNLGSIYIDDIVVDLAPSCLEISGLSATPIQNNTSTLTWNAPLVGTPLSYEYYISNTSVTPSASTVGTTVTGTSVTLTNMQVNTEYYIWVRSNCSTTENSAWSSSLRLYTGYCIPRLSGTTYYMNTVTTTGGETNINYTASSHTGSYINNTDNHIVSTYAGQTITLNAAMSGNTHYFYIWLDANNDYEFDNTLERIFTSTGYTAGVNPSFTVPAALAPGDYRIRISSLLYTNAGINPCWVTTETGVMLDFTLRVLPSCDPITLTTSVDNICSGGAGTATVVATSANATPNFAYLWSDGQTTAIATGLSAGNYTVTVTDNGRCETTATVNILSSTLAVAIDNVVGDCGVNTGAAEAIAVGSNLTYLWSDGQTTAVATGLAAGTYTVEVFDGICSKTASVSIPTTSIALTVNSVQGDCGISNGSVEVSSTSNNITLTWSDGQTGFMATGLAAGSYTVTATDGLCEIVETVEIPEIAPFSILANITDEITTNPANGAIEITSPLQDVDYLWSNGATTSTITGLTAGSYTVEVTTTSGCTSEATFEVLLITSVDNVILAAVKLYPNPTTSTVNVAGLPMDSKVTVVNNLGQVVRSFVSSNEIEQINLSDLAPSTYWIRVENQAQTIVLPVVRMK